MSFEWNHKEIEKLIELYREKPELWNPKSNNYHIKNKKHDAWVLLADKMGCSVAEVKTKMTSLLSSYRREKMKMKKTMGTGKGRDDIYISTWFAYKHFKFLAERDEPVNRIDTEAPDNENDIENVYDNVDIQNSMPDVLEKMNESQENPYHLPAEETAENAVQQPGPSNRVGKRKILASSNRPTKHKNSEDPRQTKAFNILDSVADVKRDECSTFGEHITQKLRKFTEHKRSVLRHKINDIIFNAEMELYSQNQYMSTSTPSSSAYTPLLSATPYITSTYVSQHQTEYHSISAPLAQNLHATYHSLSAPPSSGPTPVPQKLDILVDSPSSCFSVHSLQVSPLQEFVKHFNKQS